MRHGPVAHVAKGIPINTPNMPLGYVVAKVHDFELANLSTSGTGDTWLQGAGNANTMVQGTDNAAPVSPAGVMISYLPNLTASLPFTEPSNGSLGGGTIESSHWRTGVSSGQGIYFAYWVMLSPGYQGHPTGAGKEAEVFPSGSGANIVLGFHGVGSAPLQSACVINDASGDPRQGTYMGGNLSSTAGLRNRGSYDLVEWWIIMNTFDGLGNPNADGQAYGWLNGVQH